MKIFITSLFLLIHCITYSQDTLYNVVTKAVCKCLNNKLSKKELTYKESVNCVNDETEAAFELYSKYLLNKYGDSVTQQQSNEFGLEMGLNVSLALIKTCPSYRELMDTARYSLYNYLNKDSLLNEINKLNSTNSTNRTLNFYVKRARMFFWISNLKEATEDAKEILKSDSTNQLALHITSMELESHHKYEDALKIYSTLFKQTNNPRYAIDAALVKWKIDFYKNPQQDKHH